MYDLCRHIKTYGKRCQTPALSESAYCYFHSRVHTMAKAKSTIWDNINLPVLEDSASIQVAISQITSAFLCSRLDARRTGLLLYALQIASQNIDRKTFHSDSEIVRSMTVTAEGDELAPEEEVCEPSDCASCDRRDTCDDYDPDEDECDSDEEECDSDEDNSETDEEVEEPAAEKLKPEGGVGFNPRIRPMESERALAPESSLSRILPESPNLSATPRKISNPLYGNGEPFGPLRAASPTG